MGLTSRCGFYGSLSRAEKRTLARLAKRPMNEHEITITYVEETFRELEEIRVGELGRFNSALFNQWSVLHRVLGERATAIQAEVSRGGKDN